MSKSQRCDILGMNGMSLYQFQRMSRCGMAAGLTLALLELTQTGLKHSHSQSVLTMTRKEKT